MLVAGALLYAALAIVAAPAPEHPFFAATRTPEVIAHRGGAALRPENTLAAFLHAAELGADILEMDLRVTADGAIVLMHDAAVDRTTDGRGAVAALTLAEIGKLDAGFRWSADDGRTHPWRGRGIGVPTLEQVFRSLPRARMNLEMKQFSASAAVALCARVREAEMVRRVLVASFGDEPMAAFRRACPEVATSLTASEARWFVIASRVYRFEAPALQVPDRIGENVIASAALAAAARRRGLKLHVWNINEEARMRELIALGVDGIITDRPDRLLAIR